MIEDFMKRIFWHDHKAMVANLVRDNERLRDELAVCKAVLRGIAVQAEKVSREPRSKAVSE